MKATKCMMVTPEMENKDNCNAELSEVNKSSQEWNSIKNDNRQHTFDPFPTIELDLSLPLRGVGLDHDKGTSWDSAVEFPFGPTGTYQCWRGVMRWAWVPLH